MPWAPRNWGRITLNGLMTALILIAVICIFARLSNIFQHIPLNYNEGWNAQHAKHAGQGLNIYLAEDFANFPNYPPLSFYLVGWLSHVFGDHIIIGRFIALASLLVTAVSCWKIAGSIGATPTHALYSGVLLVLTTAFLFPNYVGMNDPQWLAHAFQSLALVALLASPGPRISDRQLLIAAAAVILSLLVKHNLIAVPIGITIWLAIYDRRALLRWIALGVASAAIYVAVLYGIFGSRFFQQVIGHHREYNIYRAISTFGRVDALVPFLLVALAGGIVTIRNAKAFLCTTILVLGAAIGFAFAGGVGVNYNAYFDAMIVAAPLSALFATWLAERFSASFTSPDLASAAAIALVSLPLAWNGPKGAKAVHDMAYLHRDNAQWARMIDMVRNAPPGPVACYMIAICYWADRDSEIDFFNASQTLKFRPEKTEKLLSAFKTARYQVVQTRKNSSLPQAIAEALEANYQGKEINRRFNVYMPKGNS